MMKKSYLLLLSAILSFAYCVAQPYAEIGNSLTVTCSRGIAFAIENSEGDFMDLYYGDGVQETIIGDPQAGFEETEHTYPGAGIYTLMIVVREGVLSDTADYTFEIIDPPAPEFTFSYVNGNCYNALGTEVSFVSTSTYNPLTPGLNFEWFFGDSDTAQSRVENPNNHTYTSLPGKYQVTFKINGNGACNGRYIDTVEIEMSNEITGVSTTPVCPCNKIDFEAQGTPGNDVVWDFGDLSPMTNGEDQIHNYSEPGKYWVTVESTNQNTGCIGISRNLVEICPDAIDTLTSKSNSRWYFSTDTEPLGLNFNDTPPSTLLDGRIDALEGCATLCDPNTGDLLFYTNGETVWDNNHSIMNNGTGLKGDWSSVQSALIVPDPADSNQYYIFTNGGFYGNHVPPNTARGRGVHYSIVNVVSNSVVTKNVEVYVDSCLSSLGNYLAHEAIAGVKRTGAERCDTEYWIVVPTCVGNIRSYLLTSNGVERFVESVVDLPYHNYAVGHQSVFSPSGRKYALVTTSNVELYDFDLSSGVLSNPVTLRQNSGNSQLGTNSYGVAFSPNSKLLYATSRLGRELYQYNLESPNFIQDHVKIFDAAHPDSIYSNIINYDAPHAGSLYLGKDNKIYVSRFGNDTDNVFISVIHDPDNIGLSCNFEDEYINTLRESFNAHGLQNIIPLVPKIQRELALDFDFTISGCSDVDFFYENTYCNFLPDTVSVHWDFGDGQTLDSDTLIYPSHTYSNGGTYDVTFTVSKPCYTPFTVTKSVDINALEEIDLGDQRTLCASETLILELDSNTTSSYLWSNGDTTVSTTVSDTGLYFVSVTNLNNGCISTDSVSVVSGFYPLVYLSNDTVLCEGGQVLITAADSFATDFLWQNGATTNSITADSTGTYWVEVFNICGSDTDSINISYETIPPFSLGNDITICDGDELELVAPEDSNYTYLWSTGEVTSTINIFTPGDYWVNVMSNGGCEKTDSISFEESCDIIVFVPNAFTPNDDGVNATFFPIFNTDPEEFEFYVFDRWGTRIFRSTNSNNEWDGMYKNEKCQQGIYPYIINYRDSGKDFSINGHVFLTR